MPEQNHPIRAQRLRVWICVLLGALLLYNPFAALYFSRDTIEVHTLQRNRASVGASESAGINRHVVGDERALRERRVANPSWP